MKCSVCHERSVRTIPDKSKPSIRVEVPAKVSGGSAGFNWVYPGNPAPDKMCLQCFYLSEKNKEFRTDKNVDDRWSNIFGNDFA